MGERAGRLDDRRGEPDLPADRGGGGELSRRRTPERLPGLVDSHAHLQDDQFDADLDAVLERAAEAGIERVLVPGWDLASSEKALELASRHAPMIDAAVGIHPHAAAEMDEAGWQRFETLLEDRRARALGEIGLDEEVVISPLEAQREAFGRQLALAAARGLAVLVHHRAAHAAVTEALLAWTGRPGSRARGVLHAYSGDAEMARALTDAGFVVSFALPLAFRSAEGPRAAAATLSDERFVVETDAPYLGPERGARNEPTTVLRVAAELARMRGTEPQHLVKPMRAAYDALVADQDG